MATMRERTGKDGITTFQVMFREGSKQRSRTFGDAKSAADFQDAIRVLGVKRALQEAEEKPVGLTLDDIAIKFWEWKATRVRSDRTVADYKRDYANWIQPYLGHLHAATIDEDDVQSWVDGMDGRLSAKSIGDRHSILHGIFKFACSPTRKLIPLGHNPTIGTELPVKRATRPEGLRPAEWQALYAALKTINADAADLAEFLIATGWRWSEATALGSYDVEDDGKYISVTMARVARRDSKGATVIVRDSKSDAGRRRITVDADASKMIRRRMKGLEPGALVFTTTEGSMWNYSHFHARFWSKAVKAAKITRRVTPHMLRHTAVGYLALSGKVSLAEIQRRIGHEKITTTIDIYGGMIEDVKTDALDFMAAMRNAQPKSVEATDGKELKAE